MVVKAWLQALLVTQREKLQKKSMLGLDHGKIGKVPGVLWVVSTCSG